MKAISGLAVVLFLVACAGCGAEKRVDKIPKEEREDKIPKEIQQAEKTLTKWLDGFKNQTQEQVRKSLGAPAKEGTWFSTEKKEPLLKYEIGVSTELSLYFASERVVKASLQFLP
jgi:uncharacterized Zn finger protein (UPF0148 family)